MTVGQRREGKDRSLLTVKLNTKVPRNSDRRRGPMGGGSRAGMAGRILLPSAPEPQY